jgi:succinate dehydrogenase / fumarate reductase membrane anchor subunit
MSKQTQSLRSPLSRVRGLGSAKEGVTHWWHQRLTAIALVPLTIWFVFCVFSLVGADYETTRNLLASPWRATLLCAFIACTFYHGALGLSVVIEDYVKLHGLRLGLLIGVKFLGFFLGLIAIISVLRIVSVQ